MEYGDFGACACSSYQALFPHPREPGDEATILTQYFQQNAIIVGCLVISEGMKAVSKRFSESYEGSTPSKKT